MFNNKSKKKLAFAILTPFIFSILVYVVSLIGNYNFDTYIFEIATCNIEKCTIVSKNSIFNDFAYTREIKNKKDKLFVQKIPEGFLNTYYLGSDMQSIFQTPYLLRRNAERDLEQLKENENIKIVKRNIILIQEICLGFYVIILILGLIFKKFNDYWEKQ